MSITFKPDALPSGDELTRRREERRKELWELDSDDLLVAYGSWGNGTIDTNYDWGDTTREQLIEKVLDEMATYNYEAD
ncbi:MAG: hypothetical protein WCO03_01435 [bacterium]